ncbi:hypothetical protein BDU57DRAFT_189207 [Ampelomyces quisqualis]|uniref:BTB domain-containing protein n=1 Tax=Ampelomyces quisqualis TaxID=50730 RepID=A0A6A5QU95_AMPQU|nr:hypothetical protein BDU57DRAFT_189207 [Ampelomyces quisqualis]
MAVDITVASRGDVIFKLGEEGETVTKVLISSLVMGLSSPVFDAMLNGNFAEGQARLPDQPREVALPEDDTQAMLLVFRITHMQTSDLPERLSIDAFADFALVCDKYQCTGAVQAWSKVWIAKIFESAPAADFEKLVLAIYMLDMPQEFYRATISLVRDRVADIKVIEHDDAVVAIFEILQASKRMNEGLVYASLDTVTKELGYCGPSKEWFGNIMVSLRDADIWPIRAQSVSRMKDGIARMSKISTNRCGALGCKCQLVKDIKMSLTTEIGSIYDSVQGLCLDCFKRQHLGIPGKCRVGHQGMKIE